MIKIVIIVFIVMNLIGFITCFKDKRAAVKHGWRVSEKTLFLIGFLWGAAGTFASMLIFRHKTRHWYFMLGMPVLIVLNIFTLYKVICYIGI